MTVEEAGKPTNGSRFRSTLIRVLLVQVVSLIVLWAIQARYHVL